MLLPFVIFAVLLVVVLLVTLYLLYPSSHKVSTIPGFEPSNEVEGNLPDIRQAGSLPEFLVDLHRKFGPIASFWMGKEFVVSISSPELMKETSHLFDRPALLFKYIEPLIGEQSIQYANGPEGQQRRQLQNRYFSHAKMVKQMALFREVSNELANKWLQMADGKQHVPLSVHMTNAIAKILMRTLFGDYFKDEKALIDFRKDYDLAFDTLEETTKTGQPQADPKLKACLGRLRDTVNGIIKARQGAEFKADDMLLIDEMMNSYDNEDKLFSDCMTYLIGGFHTTSYFLTWVFYFLADNPEVQEKLYKEVKKFFPADGSISWEQIKEMKYLQQVTNETNRITRIAAHAARFCSHDMILGGHKVPKNTPIIQCLTAIGTDEKLWPDPEQFNPNRFADMSKIPAYAFEPFGFAGKRKCPGYRMSEYESQVIIAALINKFKVSLVPGQVIEYKHQLVTKPSEEVWLTLEKRN